MSKLSVNINKIATLRNARGGNLPDLIRFALDSEVYGAEGITVHPRPDERHIRYDDVYLLKQRLNTELNIEGYPSERFLNLVIDIRPTQVTLVPDPPSAITSNAGWDTKKNEVFLRDIISEFRKTGIRSSIFINADEQMVEYAKATGTDRIELFTESYASKFRVNRDKAIRPFINAANRANKLGLGINAGHDLNLENLKWFSQNIPNLLEVSIGHALICDALYFGIENTIQMYLACLEKIH